LETDEENLRMYQSTASARAALAKAKAKEQAARSRIAPQRLAGEVQAK
jgi:hypothetical protein